MRSPGVIRIGCTFGNTRFSQPFLALHAGDARLPSLVLNSTVVEDGKRIVASNLKFHPLAGVDLFDGMPTADMALSTAVHNSARFTYVSPAGSLYKGGTLFGRVVDGGYFENSGAASLRELIATLAPDQQQRIHSVILSNDATNIRWCNRMRPGLIPRIEPALSELSAPVEALLDAREALFEVRVRLDELGARREKLLGELDLSVNPRRDPASGRRHDLRVLGHQMPQRQHRCPARKRVVAGVEHAPDPELAANEVDDDGAILVGDPAPDPVHADEVELRQIGPVAEFRERLVVEVRMAFRNSGEIAGERSVRRIEVGPVPACDGGGRVQIRAHPLAEAELACSARLGRGEAGTKERQARAHRIQSRVVTVGVSDVRHVA